MEHDKYNIEDEVKQVLAKMPEFLSESSDTVPTNLKTPEGQKSNSVGFKEKFVKAAEGCGCALVGLVSLTIALPPLAYGVAQKAEEFLRSIHVIK